MKDKRGAIKVITLIEFIVIIIVILLGVIIFNRIMDSKREKNNGESNISKNNVGADESNNSIINDFAFTFLQMENNNNNMIYSPLAIKYALKILQEGADQNTHEQIQSVLGKVSLPNYSNVENKISLVNGLIIREDYSKYLKQDFINNINNQNFEEIKFDKFENASRINEWIKEKTYNLMPEMMKDEEMQNKDDQMMLINSLAMDMDWEKQFAFDKTKGDTFNLEDGTQAIVTMMEQSSRTEEMAYYEAKDVTAVTIDLAEIQGMQLEFMAIMPNTKLTSYIEQLKLDDIDYITKKLKFAYKERNGLKVQIPRFSFEYDLDLEQDFANLGITDAFASEVADFSRIGDIKKLGRNLHVTKALHKAKINLSEKGIKASEVSVFGLNSSSSIGQSKYKTIKFDKPFLFLIRDKDTKEIWYAGTVYEPNLWENDMASYESGIF